MIFTPPLYGLYTLNLSKLTKQMQQIKYKTFFIQETYDIFKCLLTGVH